MRQPHQLFATGQALLGLCLLVCIAIIPSYFFSLDQGGLSNYGTEDKTVWLFVAGFGAASLGAFLAALTLPRSSLRLWQWRAGLLILAGLYLVLMLTTFSYKDNESLRQLHEYAALALFAVMLVEALWLRFTAAKDPLIKPMFNVFAIGFVLAGLTFAGLLHVLFSAQLLCGVAFGYMVVRGLKSAAK